MVGSYAPRYVTIRYYSYTIRDGKSRTEIGQWLVELSSMLPAKSAGAGGQPERLWVAAVPTGPRLHILRDLANEPKGLMGIPPHVLKYAHARRIVGLCVTIKVSVCPYGTSRSELFGWTGATRRYNGVERPEMVSGQGSFGKSRLIQRTFWA